MINKKAPGCYGLPVTNDPDSDDCKACPWFKSCTQIARDMLLEIHQQLDVSRQLAKYEIKTKPHCNEKVQPKVSERPKVKVRTESDSELQLMAKLPDKTRKVVSQLFRKDINLGLELRSGINPFDEHRPKFLRVPCRMLLEAGFTKKSLEMAFKREFPNWTDSTVKSHVALTISAFKALSLLEDHEDTFRLKQ